MEDAEEMTEKAWSTPMSAWGLRSPQAQWAAEQAMAHAGIFPAYTREISTPISVATALGAVGKRRRRVLKDDTTTKRSYNTLMRLCSRDSFEWVNEQYGLNVRRGMRVKFTGLPGKELVGKVTGVEGGYVMIKLDGHRHSFHYHPTWELTYLEERSDA